MSAPLEFLDTRPDINVLESEYKRLLGFPAAYILEHRSRELADWARDWYAKHGRAWVYARETHFELGDASVRVNGTALSSKRLRDQLHEAEANRAVMTVVSAGRECEEKARELWLEDKPDEYFFLEVYGSAVVEHLVTHTGARLCAWAESRGAAILPHYSPGYSGWDVRDQRGLYDLVCGGLDDRFPQRIQVLDSGMLDPKKTLLAVFGCTNRLDKVRSLAGLVPCENCSFSPCQFRRVPFRESLPGLEDVARLQPNPRPVTDSAAAAAPLNLKASYTVNARALRKWSNERLRLRGLGDGGFEATFRYEGTTCSNLGRSILCDYRVTLGSRDTGYAVKGVSCEPAREDTGFAEMCEYLSNRDGLMMALAEETPLLGKPLDDVLAWARPYNPAACYCNAESRNHKWGLVLEVIHYTLAEREKQTAI